MSRINSKKPSELPWSLIKDLPLGSEVSVRLNSGMIKKGTLIDHRDWLVGCPVVKLHDGEKIGIYYDGMIIGDGNDD